MRAEEHTGIGMDSFALWCELSSKGIADTMVGRAYAPVEVNRVLVAVRHEAEHGLDVRIHKATQGSLQVTAKLENVRWHARITESLGGGSAANLKIDRYAVLLRYVPLVCETGLNHDAPHDAAESTLVLIWCGKHPSDLFDARKKHWESRGFPHMHRLCVPPQGSLDVPAKYTATRAVASILHSIFGGPERRFFNFRWQHIALAVDSVCLGPHESIRFCSSRVLIASWFAGRARLFRAVLGNILRVRGPDFLGQLGGTY